MCQKQVSREGTSNRVPEYLWDVITCTCPWYLLLTHTSPSVTTKTLQSVNTTRWYKQHINYGTPWLCLCEPFSTSLIEITVTTWIPKLDIVSTRTYWYLRLRLMLFIWNTTYTVGLLLIQNLSSVKGPITARCIWFYFLFRLKFPYPRSSFLLFWFLFCNIMHICVSKLSRHLFA